MHKRLLGTLVLLSWLVVFFQNCGSQEAFVSKDNLKQAELRKSPIINPVILPNEPVPKTPEPAEEPLPHREPASSPEPVVVVEQPDHSSTAELFWPPIEVDSQRSNKMPFCPTIAEPLLTQSVDQPRLLIYEDFNQATRREDLGGGFKWNDYFLDCKQNTRNHLIVKNTGFDSSIKNMVADFLNIINKPNSSGQAEKSAALSIVNNNDYEEFNNPGGNLHKARVDLSYLNPIRTMNSGDEVWGAFSLYYPEDYKFLNFNHLFENETKLNDNRSKTIGVGLHEAQSFQVFNQDPDLQRVPNGRICGQGGGPIGIGEKDRRLSLSLRYSEASTGADAAPDKQKYCGYTKKSDGKTKDNYKRHHFILQATAEVFNNLPAATKSEHFKATLVNGKTEYHVYLKTKTWYDIAFHYRHCAGYAKKCQSLAEVWIRFDRNGPYIPVAKTNQKWGDYGVTPQVMAQFPEDSHHQFSLDFAYYAHHELKKFRRCRVGSGSPLHNAEEKAFGPEDQSQRACYYRYGETEQNKAAFQTLPSEPYIGKSTVIFDDIRVFKYTPKRTSLTSSNDEEKKFEAQKLEKELAERMLQLLDPKQKILDHNQLAANPYLK